MKIIVGLGNIGNEYSKTYHNMGFITLDNFASKHNFAFTKTKCDAQVAEGFIDGQKIILAKPTTYMNNSGISIRQLLSKNGCELKDLLVIVDDIDLPVGKLRYRINGSSGTHNGLRSCVNELQSQDFARLRIGIGKPENGMDLANYVLSKIDDEKFSAISSLMPEAMQKIEDFINNKE